MREFTPLEIAEIIEKVIDATSAGPGTAKFQNAPYLCKELIEEGSDADVFSFCYGLAVYVTTALDLKNLRECPCGQAGHEAEIAFGFAPISDDGEPDMTNAFFGGVSEVPDELREQVPEMISFAELVTAAIRDDVTRAVEVWSSARTGGYAVRLIYVAMRQAGAIQRAGSVANN